MNWAAKGMLDKIPIALLFLLVSGVVCLAQTTYRGLTPGRSSRVEVERVLGQPVAKISETLIEYAPQEMAQKIYVQYREGASVAERIELIYDPQSAALLTLPNLSVMETPFRKTQNGKNREHYYGAPHFVVETLEFGESYIANRIRVAYFSPEWFDAAMARPGIIKSAPPIALGSWAGHDGDGRYINYDFLDGNKLRLTHIRDKHTRYGTWKVKDFHVFMEATSDRGIEKYAGVVTARTVQGNRRGVMSGTYTVGPRTVHWEATQGPADEVNAGILAGTIIDEHNRLAITDVLINGPAARARLRKGDVIVEIDGQSTVGMSHTTAHVLIFGYSGSSITLKIHRPEGNRTFDVKMSREACCPNPR